MKTLYSFKNLYYFFIIPFFFVSQNLKAQNTATSIKPGTITTTNAGGNFNWTNAIHAQAEDQLFATALISGANKTTYNLDAQNWGFQSSDATAANYIPGNATINGIRVLVKLRKSLAGTIRDNKVVLLKNGVEAGNNKASTSAVWPTTASFASYGNEIDNWGIALTPSDLTNSNFGVRISASNKGRKDAQAEIDHIKIIVYFNQTFYYSKSTGNLELTTTWGTNPDGSGTTPANFTRDGQLFTLKNRSSAALTGDFTISGTNSSLIIGDGSPTTLTIPATYTLNSKVNLKDYASLIVSNTKTPILGSVGNYSTVTYNAASNQVIADALYYNLTLSGNGSKLFSTNASGTTTIASSLTIASGVTADNQGNNIFVGGNANSITNNGAAMGTGTYVYSSQISNTSISGNGTFSNLEIDASTTNNNAAILTLANPIAITNSLTLTEGILANGRNLSLLPGSTIYIGEGILNSSLSSTGYNVTYIAMAGTTLTTGNELSGSLHHMTIQLSDGSTLALNKNLVLTGNLVLNGGTFDPTDNYSITIGGDFINQATLTPRTTTFTFNGSTVQHISGNGPFNFYHLKVQQVAGGSLRLNKPVNVTKALTLTNGIISTSGSTPLTLTAEATLAGGSSSSYINGPLIRLFTNALGTHLFPIGKDNAYRPITLSVALNTNAPTAFTAEMFSGAPPVRSLTTGLQNTSLVRYFTVSPDNGSNISSASITLPYDTDEGISNPSSLRIAKSSGSDWINIGGSGTAAGNGTITSASFSSFSDFVLANTRQATALPLTWLEFKANPKAAAIELQWKTGQEYNTADFKVEKSIDGQHWTDLATLKSNNNPGINTYTYSDASPASVNYYRILQRDQDGKYSYSRILRVLHQATTGSLTLMPNRISGGTITAMIQDEAFLQSSRVRVRIFDLSGKLIFIQSQKPTAVFSLSIPGLSPGNYVLVVNNETKQLQAHLVVQ